MWVTEGCPIAAAGFRLAPHRFDEPFIILNPEVIARAPFGEEASIAAGLAIHETAHLRWTRKLYELSRERPRDEHKATLANLLEDYRIEQLTMEESPGWKPLVQCAAVWERIRVGACCWQPRQG